VYASGDPVVQKLVDAFREVYGPSARAMPVKEFDVLGQAAELVDGCEVEMDLAGLPDDLAAWADDAEFTEDD
jgi:hypothetical protein